MGERGGPIGRGRGMIGRGGPGRGRGMGDRGAMSMSFQFNRGMRGGGMRGRGGPPNRGGGAPRPEGAPAEPQQTSPQQGEAIPTTGGRGGMGAPRGIPTRGSYPPRGMMGGGMRGRGGPGRGMRGMDRGGRGGGMRGRIDGFIPRGRPEGAFIPRGGRGGEMRGRGDFVPRGRGAPGGGFDSRSAPPRGGMGGYQKPTCQQDEIKLKFMPRGRGGFDRGRGGDRGAPRGRGSGMGFQQRNSSSGDQAPYRQQQNDYRGGYQQQGEGLKRPPMGMSQPGSAPKRGRFEDQQQDPYQSGYYRQGQQGGYDNYQSQSGGSYSNGNTVDYSYSQNEMPQADYMAPAQSAPAYGAADPYSSYQMPAQQTDQRWGSDPYNSGSGYGGASSGGYAQSAGAYNGRNYNAPAPAYGYQQ
ncbi:myosin heavy chain IB-like isoform X4 [Cloeon dipterum]|uniref:myosin heavy chain IB-like isoform X4 n=1 Tax=Cloeon dipterum TaxID=197152 RepID=UPI003220282C